MNIGFPKAKAQDGHFCGAQGMASKADQCQTSGIESRLIYKLESTGSQSGLHERIT